MPTLWSPHDIDECVERLNAATDPPLRLWGKNPVVGGVWGWTFSGIRRAPLDYRSQFLMKMHARLRKAEAGGTVLKVGFRPSNYTIFFNLLWFGMLLTFSILAASRTAYQRNGLELLIIPLFMLCGGGTYLFLSWRRNRDDPRFLYNYVIRILDAVETRS